MPSWQEGTWPPWAGKGSQPCTNSSTGPTPVGEGKLSFPRSWIWVLSQKKTPHHTNVVQPPSRCYWVRWHWANTASPKVFPKWVNPCELVIFKKLETFAFLFSQTLFTPSFSRSVITWLSDLPKQEESSCPLESWAKSPSGWLMFWQ